MLRAIMRTVILCVSTIVGVALLGVAASIFAALRGVDLYSPWDLGLWMVAAAVAAGVGFFAMPFVAGTLIDADLRKSLPRVFAIALPITCTWAFLIPWGFGITASAPAFISVIVLSAWCADRFPLQHIAGFCERCHYDLSGCTTPGCPECGWGRGVETKSP